MAEYDSRTIARFWSKVDRRGPNECWPWLAGLDADGYGRIRVDDRGVLAHRLSSTISKGPTPEGLCVCHSCDADYPVGDISYRRCVNPLHLFTATHGENIRDMVAKGRHSRLHPAGEKASRAKISEADAIAILKSGETMLALSNRFGICAAQVWRIRHGKRWAHLSAKKGISL